MLALLFTLLLLGPCAPSEEELLFCEGCAALDLTEAEGGAGGDAGADQGGSGGDPGGAGGDGTPPCECDDGNSCNGAETCAADGSCVTTGAPVPADDRDACTDDFCDNGAPVHQEIPIDDGDPCTKDYCDHDLGVLHYPIAACSD
jgi:hypothetical protein